MELGKRQAAEITELQSKYKRLIHGEVKNEVVAADTILPTDEQKLQHDLTK
jgi:hypothetical protein